MSLTTLVANVTEANLHLLMLNNLHTGADEATEERLSRERGVSNETITDSTAFNLSGRPGSVEVWLVQKHSSHLRDGCALPVKQMEYSDGLICDQRLSPVTAAWRRNAASY